ncbi:MAG: hypothetical protein DI587_11200 [Variovorax paradoxus]|nr:MAG: hypothetical protein DI583_11200 [Variovorax paradoxus]PZQ11014.1 MAG: hypothetical protein DI587_11200 [Variovorax paradoxus]
MGKRNRHGAKARAMQPDEVFIKGPIRVTRFGNNVVWQSNWTDGEHDRMMAKMAQRYPEVIAEIDALVDRIVAAVGALPPDQLLLLAWQEQAMTTEHVKVEADVGREDVIAHRMVDYVQGVIAAAPRAHEQKAQLEEADWKALKADVTALFSKINGEYLICATAHARATGSGMDEAMEEFHARAQMHWCHVRGDYYQFHQVDVMADLLRSQSSLIEAAYGITSEQLVGEIKKVWTSLTFGFGAAQEALFCGHSAFVADVDRLRDAGHGELEGQDFEEMLRSAAERVGYGAAVRQAMGVVFEMGLFDLQRLTDLPAAFLDDFSWAPGQDSAFLADGPFRGWPLRIQPVFKRPFLKLNGKHYCFDIHTLFDNFYRQLEKRIYVLLPGEKQAWIANRKAASEALPIEDFERLLPGASVHREVYYPLPAGPGEHKHFAEADCVLVYDDHLFVIEVKAGAFTYTSPANDLPAYVRSLQALVGDPGQQGHRFLTYLESADEVPIFDAKRRPVGRLRKGDFRCMTVCAVTLDAFSELAAQSQHLHLVGVSAPSRPIWSLSLSDLRVYRDVFAGPLHFLHFVEQRMRASSSTVLRLDDELDHLGLYFEHNDYEKYASEMSQQRARMQFTGYRSPLDAYFSARLAGLHDAPRPAQKIPAQLQAILAFLTRSGQHHRSRIASCLLDLADDARSALDEYIDRERGAILARGRCAPFSMLRGVRLTVILSLDGLVSVDHDKAVEHCQSAMILAGQQQGVLLQLGYDAQGPVRASLTTVTLQGLSARRMQVLTGMAAQLRDRRLQRSVADYGKVGRNELCPCGTGAKFKKCCALNVR